MPSTSTLSARFRDGDDEAGSSERGVVEYDTEQAAVPVTIQMEDSPGVPGAHPLLSWGSTDHDSLRAACLAVVEEYDDADAENRTAWAVDSGLGSITLQEVAGTVTLDDGTASEVLGIDTVRALNAVL